MTEMLIAFTGKKRSGKDTAAQALEGFRKESFAAPIRKAVADILDWSPEELEIWKEERIEWLDGVTARHMMQTLGTEWGRHKIHPELWLRALERRIRQCPRVVITDVRFDNEAEFVKKLGGVVIQVERPCRITDEHISEKGVDRKLIDFFVFNDSSIPLLHRQVRDIVNSQWMRA